MAREESSKQAKKRMNMEKAGIKAALANIHDKNLRITEQEENPKKKAKKKPNKKAKVVKAKEQEDSNNVTANRNSTNDLNEEMVNPSNGTQQTTRSRGPTTCSGLTVNTGTKWEVELNALGQPIGGNSRLLSSFVGCLTRELVPLNYDDWRKIHMVQKECYWQAVSQKFTFNGRESEAKAYILGEMGRLVRSNKAKYGIKLDKKPKNIDLAEWDTFVKSRASKKFKAKSMIFKGMREKQTLPYRGSRKGFARIEDEIYKKEGPISKDKVRLRTWLGGYEKRGEAVEIDETIIKAKEMLAAPPSESSHANSNYDEDALSKLLKKHDRRGRITAKGAGACQTKLNAISMTSSKVTELEGNISTLQGEVKDLRSLVEEQFKYINYILKEKSLDVEKHNIEEDRDEDDVEDNGDDKEDNDEDDDHDSDDEDSDGDQENVFSNEHNKDPKIPSNTSTTPQSQSGSINRVSKKCKLLNWRARNEVVAIGSWMTDDPNTIVHFVPLGKHASKV